ncbi:hypothetical protein SHIRM173S_00118 [Streptomyces hirsutus]
MLLEDEKVVVTQPEQGDFKAFSAICAHRNCLVASVSDGTVDCACHGSRFRITDGSVERGPATGALPAERITVEGNSIRPARAGPYAPGHAFRRAPGPRPHGLRLRHGFACLRPGHGGQRHRPPGRLPRSHSPVLALRQAADPCRGPGRGTVQLGAGTLLRELALRANPNILECLHSPFVEYADDTGRELLALRGAFLSRRVHGTFTRYAYGQRRKLEADVRVHGAPRWKHAMHLLRLLASARDVLRTGVLTVDVGEHREPLLAVKRGEVPWSEVEARMARLEQEAAEALHRTPLPAQPDRRRIEDFLVRVRRASALRAG